MRARRRRPVSVRLNGSDGGAAAAAAQLPDLGLLVNGGGSAAVALVPDLAPPFGLSQAFEARFGLWTVDCGLVRK